MISRARSYLSYEVLIANVCPFLCSCGPSALSPRWGGTLHCWYWLFYSGVFHGLNVSITSACKRIRYSQNDRLDRYIDIATPGRHEAVKAAALRSADLMLGLQHSLAAKV